MYFFDLLPKVDPCIVAHIDWDREHPKGSRGIHRAGYWLSIAGAQMRWRRLAAAAAFLVAGPNVWGRRELLQARAGAQTGAPFVGLSLQSGNAVWEPLARQLVVPRRSAATWGSTTWNWGDEVGDAHDMAAKLRGQLQERSDRAMWLQGAVVQPNRVPWADMKLALALLWQKAMHEGRDGGPAGWRVPLSRMVAGTYEGGEAGDRLLVVDMEVRLPASRIIVEDGPEDMDGWRRRVAAQVFKELDFVEGGF
eukprot:TRINITY_DN46451_c0_g1_i1.p1 TRINITY_DN46451_c0_g1~~TRINITY_DN46451_c0_g1_i1.p1  ORF type:complete len:251 (-),score=41.41 TRINITY_DN46451_c0_g1_i1:97-849(-)